jgi:2-(1,2-epoxy-1,2-dihydrophenyl)acetyl-CoA isomerase
MSHTVTRDDAGGVATITLQRPALSSALRGELLAVVQDVAADETVRAVLLTGSGRAFCVGQDLAEHVESLRGNAATSLSVVEEEYNPLIMALAALRVPVVVGINGACAGAGLGIALAGDLRVAAAGAKFTTAFTGIGLSSDSALASRLVHSVGGSRAAQLLLLPEPFLAETAAEWGLVHRVVPPEQVLPAGAQRGRLEGGAAAAAPRAVPRRDGRRVGSGPSCRPAGAGTPGGAFARGPAGAGTDGVLPGGEDGARHGGHRLTGGDARARGAAADGSRADGRPP